MTIYIYKDTGTDPFCIRQTAYSCALAGVLPKQIRYLDHKQLLASSWEDDAKVFIMPGGRDIPYHRLLRGRGNEKIRSFVESGGSYLGICAGAYFGAKKVLFEVGTELEVTGDRELQFFAGSAIGTLFKKTSFSYHSHLGASSAWVSIFGESFPIYYNGGCYFSEEDEESFSHTVLGTYIEEDDKSAIVLCPFGKGKAVLSGVHIEIGYEGLSEEESVPEHLLSIAKQHEKRRQKLFHSVLELL